MNKNQKEYSVLEIKKHKNKVEQLEKNADTNRWFLYGSIGLAVIAFNTGNNLEEVSKIASNISDTIGWFGVAGGIHNLKNMIFNISKKAGLENAIDRIEYEMKLSEFEESNDKGGPRR